jgi:hypothetical protein
MGITDLIGFGRDLGTRFALLGLLPGGMLALFVLALVWSGAPGDAPDLDQVLDHARDLDGWAGGLLFLALVVVAIVLQPLQLALVRVLEGYWPESLARGLRKRQARRRQALVDASTWRPEASGAAGSETADATGPDLGPDAATVAAMADAETRLRRLFPSDPAWVLPTALGNALRAAESRAGEPYGLDAVVAWPRLYPLLPEGVRAVVDDQRDSLDIAARLCAVFAAAAVISLVLLATHGWWLLVPAGCLGLAWLSYRGAVAAAVAYGEGIRAAIDLHRFDLLAALHLPLPATLEQERAVNEQVSLFLRQGWPVELVYEHGAGDAERA